MNTNQAIPQQPNKPALKPAKNSKLVIIIIVVLLLCCAVGYILLSFNTTKLSVTGNITDSATGSPIIGAEVSIGKDQIAITDNNGKYLVDSIERGTKNIQVKAQGYETLSEDVNLSPGFLSTQFVKDFSLTLLTVGSVQGKFTGFQSGYRFIEDKLLINSKEYKISSDGTFSLSDVKLGESELVFVSNLFKDVNTIITVREGENRLVDIELIPAGDIIGELKSYITEEVVQNVNFAVENINTKQIETLPGGTFRIKDLEVGRKYKIRVSSEGFNTRDYEIQIAQGVNELFDFKLTENGTAVFLVKTGSDHDFYKSDYDGFGETKIIEIPALSVFGQLYKQDENIVYFASKHKEGDSFSGSDYNIYALSLENVEVTKLSKDTVKLKKFNANFYSKKILSSTEISSGNILNSKLQLFDFSSNELAVVREGENLSFSNLNISDSGDFLFYSQKDTSTNLFSIYRYGIKDFQVLKLIENQESNLLDSSQNGEKSVLTRKNPNTNFTDLVLYNASTKEIRTLVENFTGKRVQFNSKDENEIIYITTKNSQADLYRFVVDKNKEERLTVLTSDQEIFDFYQENEYLFYITNKGLYVLDTKSPKTGKLVSSLNVIYRGYN